MMLIAGLSDISWTQIKSVFMKVLAIVNTQKTVAHKKKKSLAKLCFASFCMYMKATVEMQSLKIRVMIGREMVS